MNVSVIIPAYNAAPTIAQTLESLLAQTHRSWEAIVVDDGSTDQTWEIAARFAHADSRIRYIRQVHAGEAAARNTALGSASGDWVLCLDADDWIVATALERWTATLGADVTLDAVHCGWVLADPMGMVFGIHRCIESGDMFPTLATRPAFPIHSCIVRRTLVDAVGCFDPSLGTCADWDLWQRVARMGARFGALPEPLAWYRMRPNARWTDAPRFATDGLRLVAQGHARDPRVPNPTSIHATGRPADELAPARLCFVCLPAGMDLGRGGDALRMLDSIREDRGPDLDPERVASNLFSAVLIAGCHPPDRWQQIWPALEPRLDAFLHALEDQALATGLARRSRAILERLVLDHVPPSRPCTIGRTHQVTVEVTKPIPNVEPGDGIEHLQCPVTLEGQPIGRLDLPVCDGLVPAPVLADAIAAEYAWAILGRFFERTIYPQITVTDRVARRGTVQLADGLDDEEAKFRRQLHDRAGWTVFLQELWGRPEWPHDPFYGSVLEEKAASPMASPGPLVGAESRPEPDDRWRIVEISEPLPALASDRPALDVELTLGGASVGIFSVPLEGGIARPHRVLTALTYLGGFELCRVAVREAVLGVPLDAPGTLRERLAAAARAKSARSVPRTLASRHAKLSPLWQRAVASALPAPPRGTVLARHAPGPVGSSASRHAALPRAAAAELRRAAAVAGEPAVRIARMRFLRPQRVVYAPDLLWRTDGRDGATADPSALPEGASERLPILMYHRVAPTGAAATARYRVTPEAFEQHVRYLADAGYHSVTIEQWRMATQWRRALPGRAVLFTFDDGYRDFQDYAWPTLRRYGFSAMVFLVADHIGETNVWDAVYGEAVPLLRWEEILRLRDEGVEFGSHTATHARLTGLSPTDVVHEAARSRATLQRGIERFVTSIAYPHGDEDAVVRHLVGACGYLFGFSCRPGRSTFDDSLLALARIEVTGSDTLQGFIAKLE